MNGAVDMMTALPAVEKAHEDAASVLVAPACAPASADTTSKKRRRKKRRRRKKNKVVPEAAAPVVAPPQMVLPEQDALVSVATFGAVSGPEKEVVVDVPYDNFKAFEETPRPVRDSRSVAEEEYGLDFDEVLVVPVAGPAPALAFGDDDEDVLVAGPTWQL